MPQEAGHWKPGPEGAAVHPGASNTLKGGGLAMVQDAGRARLLRTGVPCHGAERAGHRCVPLLRFQGSNA